MWKSVTATVLLAASAFATPFASTGYVRIILNAYSHIVDSHLRFCGSSPVQEVVSAVQDVLTNAKFPNEGVFREDATQGAFTVPVMFNIFYDQNNPSDGNFSDSVITQQMNVINSYFSPVRLTFAVQAVNRYAVPYSLLHGVTLGSANEATIKQVRRGNAQTLNIYTVGQGPSNLAGWATFPWEYQQNQQNDGIVMDYNYLPGGKNVGYNTGKITVHEIGHWTGLLHTFQDGCNGGDQVDDTPPEASPASGCPTGRDTCPAPGADPIDNMMDYSDDGCRVRFTSGQYNRLAQVIYQYRGINLY
ncbi:hypothetical protein H0H93_016746 [Arthromyces matolae]|nr:hypothetical protein H0H93_016746 [Arthromyces matolae]